ncbi:Protein of unknown function [Aliiroseovarius crassostreae]|uniref:Inner membrane protein YgaP-like transmembrane domain-containing protein n=1 Tax=Aliiroseovarius crassostreae TaxID=154981 RepID=A0A0P7JPQ8_9RHOB|nr:DUF2892 domain-containing protein [Aliiroseovarius crassostreae]KPN63310.1 hypothetical protein AKJ29_11550 [Aliiroseovarius crassostreae]SFU41389.1 Protein of unknown function [Aliiroseovarius crassostreae]
MTKNIGGIDRIIRIAIGATLIVWAIMGGPIWAWIGIVPMATAILGWCPPYAILGFSACKMKN